MKQTSCSRERRVVVRILMRKERWTWHKLSKMVLRKVQLWNVAGEISRSSFLNTHGNGVPTISLENEFSNTRTGEWCFLLARNYISWVIQSWKICSWGSSRGKVGQCPEFPILHGVGSGVASGFYNTFEDLFVITVTITLAGIVIFFWGGLEINVYFKIFLVLGCYKKSKDEFSFKRTPNYYKEIPLYHYESL